MSETKILNSFKTKSSIKVGDKTYTTYKLSQLEKAGFTGITKLPYSIRVLLENLLRQEDGRLVRSEDIKALAQWSSKNLVQKEIPFIPARVILQDFTGVPVVVDLAAMRDAAKKLGQDPKKINPLFPVDLVIDHSVQVDAFGSSDAFQKNAEMEYQRNRERYSFLKWGQKSLQNFRAIPPDVGIVHQINLEYLATVASQKKVGDEIVVFPDTLIGTDSHTTMINGVGVVGWGVGGIEAEAAMLGQPLSMLIPEVIGFKLMGKIPEGATATDAVLTITQMLRAQKVVGKFVEFFGPGLSDLSLPDRATISNMAPEYGATIGFFPVDEETLAYLKLSGRSPEQVALVEAYYKDQGLFRTNSSQDPDYTDTLELDLSTVVPSLAGPKRPQDRIPLKEAKSSFQKVLKTPVKERGFELSSDALKKSGTFQFNGTSHPLNHGAVVIAAITSCTNTSNPSVLIAAGLVAQKALEKGLMVKPYVKTSLAPGSQVVMDYLEAAGLKEPLEKLNFHLVGYGCTTCIGNSGPLPESVAKAIQEGDLVATSVLSGNRNFEGRVNPLVKANYLASPPLVVAYALAGRMDMNLYQDPIGESKDGTPVFLKDIWPTHEEIQKTLKKALKADMFRTRYAKAAEGDKNWNSLPVPEGDLYAWNDSSTYIKNPPYFEGLTLETTPVEDIQNARVLALLGDSVTTDHISPAGAIAKDSPAAKYLTENGVDPVDFNSYGSRRGNHEVMIRGTFANIRLKNLLVPGTEGGVTLYHPSKEKTTIYEASEKYKRDKTPLIVIAGKEYGTGSSRDWAAKGTRLLGIRTVIAESYERIHRSNLVGMGVLPLQFKEGESKDSLGLTGTETFTISGVAQDLSPRKKLTVTAKKEDGTSLSFEVITRIDTPVEVEYYQHGGILQAVLRQICRA